MIINGKKIDFANNFIKYLELKGYSQQDFCNLTGHHPAQISRWVNGINEPYVKTLFKIDSKLENFIAELISSKSEVSKNNLNFSNNINNIDVKFTQKGITNAKLNLMIVPLKAYGGFLNGYNNPDFITSLEYYHFPFIDSPCIAFEVDDFGMYKYGDEDSMKQGDYVVVAEIANIEWLTKGKIYVILTIDRILIKIFDKIEEEMIHFYSLNESPEYKPIVLPSKSIKKMYYKELIIKK